MFSSTVLRPICSKSSDTIEKYYVLVCNERSDFGKSFSEGFNFPKSKMTRWKLTRQAFGVEEFTFAAGQEVTVGRGMENTIALASIVVSRVHCVMNFKKEKVLITDLKSSNGVYVGKKKIPQNTPFQLKDSDILGFGWTVGAPLLDVSDKEKFAFKLVRETPPVISRLKFQSEIDEIEKKIAALGGSTAFEKRNQRSPILGAKSSKRKLDLSPKKEIKTEFPEKINSRIFNIDNDIINVSDSDDNAEIPDTVKKLKLEAISEESLKSSVKTEPIKTEQEDLEYEAFKVKQENLGYDDEPIQIDSDNDSEDDHWFIRLSQSSPGKPFTHMARENNMEKNHEDSSYSQMEDFLDEEEFLEDMISIPPEPPRGDQDIVINETPQVDSKNDVGHDEAINEITHETDPIVNTKKNPEIVKEQVADKVDGMNVNGISKCTEIFSSDMETQNDLAKKTQMIEALQLPRKKTSSCISVDSKPRSSSSNINKDKNNSSSKRHIMTDSQKEERRKRLKEIATKEKVNKTSENASNSPKDKASVNAKVTTSNRGAFLTGEVKQGVVMPVKRKESPRKSIKVTDNSIKMSLTNLLVTKEPEPDGIEIEKNQSEKSNIEERRRSDEHIDNKSSNTRKCHNVSETRVPLKNVKPLTESKESFSGKPISKVEPYAPQKTKKKVRFSDAPPTVHEFEIEEGNSLRNLPSIKTALVDSRQRPVFNLEKLTLVKILRWNPQWLDEQLTNNDPPPILGHNNHPTMFHSFRDHKQYVNLVGDLLLMEIWECLTQGYMKAGGSKGIEMRIESLPPAPPQERYYELFNFSVNISVLNSEQNTVPRKGQIILVAFGSENARNRRFFFVYNVKVIPSPPNNKYTFYSISLQACYTEKMRTLRIGEMIVGCCLAYINNELTLFEAMEYLARSPLSDAILKPEPRHFIKCNTSPLYNKNSQWTKTLNPSQHMAVNSSVSAALGDRPGIQMVQGPPGTGKSSVICAIVMSYFYDSHGKIQHNRGKILICATSNAAVDELVIRLLNIRQSLPKSERFRMVRVGRAESMHPRAHDVSLVMLAQRDARLNAEPAKPGVNEEIAYLQAKVNMWERQAQDAKDGARVAYCQSRVAALAHRITLLRSGVGADGAGGREALAMAEQRVIDGAHIIVTTLSSAHNARIRGLKRRIALCIVDEAGQAIEPQTLIPLTLDVTRLTLIGDPQQLPGFICSQRAKQRGLGESLFSRLSSASERWSAGSPVVLLNQQYRMQAEIADYPNRAFYDRRIQTLAPTRPDLNIPPYAIVSVSSGDKGQNLSGANEMEAWAVCHLVVALNRMLRDRGLSLAVITPYNAHKELIKKNLWSIDPTTSQVEVNTVDSFQGQERDVVVVSLARSQGVGFLIEAGRMNVMLTRAKYALMVVLNPHATLRNYQWRSLVEDAQVRNVYRVLPNKMCQPSASPDDDILKYIITTKKSRTYN